MQRDSDDDDDDDTLRGREVMLPRKAILVVGGLEKWAEMRTWSVLDFGEEWQLRVSPTVHRWIGASTSIAGVYTRSAQALNSFEAHNQPSKLHAIRGPLNYCR